MITRIQKLVSSIILILLLVMGLVVTGCSEQPEIRQSTMPQPSPPQREVTIKCDERVSLFPRCVVNL